ncbi:NPP1 family protein [Oceanobacter mangrovi]|uniref:NPP1 family protein n=1 Tax=Oceanobacter mangrovi TaxID=2862510 RepID=UPI001FE51436|nr:NPP1 family protein [Oceanobacter mangrovi]
MRSTTLKPLLPAASLAAALMLAVNAQADDFAALDQAMPTAVDAASIAPVFDFDSDSCLPAAGISRRGDQNGGQKPSGSLTGACRSSNFMELSNTVHRYACQTSGSTTYCGHFYALYFEKDQIFDGIESGHRHDWEYAAVWTTNGVVTHGSYSAHGDLTTSAASELEFENGHLKIVYHKDGVATHALRFAKTAETAENPYGAFVTPPIISWYEFAGDGWSNLVMRNLLNNYDYGSANLPVRESSFLSDMNEFKPSSYPTFTQADVLAANGGSQESWQALVNNASGLCLDINNADMTNGTNVMQWTCSGANWQQRTLDTSTGMIHSLQDPRFCLDNSSVFENGANIIIWNCWAGDSQRFVENSDGSIGLEVDNNQVLDGVGSAAGDNVDTWWNWGGDNQRWTWQ